MTAEDEEVIPEADMVILGVPDVILGKVSEADRSQNESRGRGDHPGPGLCPGWHVDAPR